MIALYTSAYAKLNLYLDVIGKREDGYHNIESVMQAVTLHDDMEILLGTKEPWCVDSDWDCIPKNEKNLCWKAAELFFNTLGEDPDGLTVHILKRIPMEAGLAGGSSDAAAVLRALDVHYGKPFSLDDLCRMGSAIGSDVPFCVLGGTAITEEKGQILFPIIHEPQLYYVVCKPTVSISTAEMYAEIDRQNIQPAEGTKSIVNGFHKQSPCLIAKNMFNVFEPIAVRKYPVIGELKQKLISSGALNAQMTGSGSAVFGLFDNIETAAQACEELHDIFPDTFLCTNGSLDS